MNMVDKPEGLDDNLECFDVAGERLLVFASNVPDQTYNEFKDDAYGHCYASQSDFEKKKSWNKPYYSCFRGESSPRAWPAQELGDDAARKTAGMAFYKGKKRVRYKRFKQNQLKSMKDAIDMCKKSKF